MHRRIGLGGAAALGLSVFLFAPAAHADETGTASGATATIHVPSDFDTGLETVNGSGGYEPVAEGLHIWTKDASTDKVAEYVDTDTPLAKAGEPSLDYTPSRAGLTDPGFQLVVDLDGNGSPDGILVGEPGSYGTDWWLPHAWNTDVHLDGAPGPADGYTYSGPLTAWRAAYPSANVLAFGFSLGTGPVGDGTLHAIDFAGTHYTFAPDVVLTSKDQCKGAGWATSTLPVYKNQGECVSSFARVSNNGNDNINDKNGNDKNVNGTGATGLGAPVSTATGSTAPIVRTPRNSGKIRAI